MNIAGKKWVAWKPDDESWLVGARVIGRAELQLEGGGIVHALVIEHDEAVGTTRAVYLDRQRGCFVTVEMVP